MGKWLIAKDFKVEADPRAIVNIPADPVAVPANSEPPLVFHEPLHPAGSNDGSLFPRVLIAFNLAGLVAIGVLRFPDTAREVALAPARAVSAVVELFDDGLSDRPTTINDNRHKILKTPQF